MGRTDSRARITVRVRPRSSREAVEGWQEGMLMVRLTSPPVEGAANSALVKLLAKRLGIATRRVKIVGGERSKTKIIEVEGLTLDEVSRELNC
ncbi:MAG: DUF167 domain-containing protein [bacterium]|nr:MAG: DUF167 domain-containing protein [bacterium]